jgi:hypothetical protein
MGNKVFDALIGKEHGLTRLQMFTHKADAG